MTPADASELVAILTAAFPRNQVNERTCQVYERMLLDLERDAAHKAVSRLICTQKWMPTVAEIRAAVVEVEHGAPRLGAEAWGEVGMAVRLFGRYQSPAFDDPLVAECVRQMGWLSICNSTNEPSERARFIELYDGLSAQRRANLVAGAKYALPERKHERLDEKSGLSSLGSMLQKWGNQ